MNISISTLLFWRCLELQRKNYEKSLEHFSRVHIKHHFIKAELKKKILICFYELNLFDSIISHLDAFKHFIVQTKEFNSAYKEHYSKFLWIYNEIVNLKMRPAKITTDKLSKINRRVELCATAKVWFTEKLEELKKMETRTKQNKKESQYA